MLRAAAVVAVLAAAGCGGGGLAARERETRVASETSRRRALEAHLGRKGLLEVPAAELPPVPLIGQGDVGGGVALKYVYLTE